MKHLVLSHHGQDIWGSPKKPMTLEAVMLHYLDDMDAKINGIQQFLRFSFLRGRNGVLTTGCLINPFMFHPMGKFGTYR